jgi:integrase
LPDWCVTSVCYMTSSRGSSFLVRNRFGIFCFQRRIAKKYREQTPSLPVFVRLSLRTKSKPLAKKLARSISVVLDLRADEYFDTLRSFNDGIRHLQDSVVDASATDALSRFNKRLFNHAHESIPCDSAYEKLTALINSKISTTAPSIQSIASTPNVLLSDAFEDFLTTHRGRWKVSSGMEKSFRETFFPFLIAITGNVYTNALTKLHINELAKILLVYPANKNKKHQYKNNQPRDFLHINTAHSDRLSPTTKKKYITHIGTFLRWLKSTDFTSIDLDAPLKSLKIHRTRAADQRSVFTATDLAKLFNSDAYTLGRHQTASRFWVPLIALYSGARLNEICQLSTNDIHMDDSGDRWVIDFNENDDVPFKSLKKPHHARLVPVHQNLLKLGFIDYWESIKKTHVRLFPELTYKRDENKYGNDIQKWFNRTYCNKRNCNITTAKTSFHSFRHTVITHLATVHSISENKVAAGLGQSATGGVYETRYAKHHAYSNYAKYFDLIDFSDCFDINKINYWKKHKFVSSM